MAILLTLMRLKQVEVHGFKTFANRTDFAFREGITAIVGPNGCGKSNIADAIRWALGEQSPSNLRTKKTEDLIFTGSATRPRMGMAEVALTLENPFALEENDPSMEDPSAPFRASSGQMTDENQPSTVIGHPSANGNGDEQQRPKASIVEEVLRARPSEVTILRRAYRSGENEYLINRQRVRLRDVQDLLQRWGLARLTYAVIGQGLIDQALSLRAEERRALFEEAAGIGLYQSRKANALEKLEETQQNLIRVNDIINEIAPRLPSLARQADRASKYESVAGALSEKLRQWYAFQWAHAQEGFISAQQEEASARDKLNAQKASMHEVAEQLTQARRTAQTLRAKLSDHRRAEMQRENDFAAHERDLAVLQERVRFAETQHTDAARELENAKAAAQATVNVYETAIAQFAHASDLPESTAPKPEAQIVAEPDVDTEFEQKQRAEAERLAETARAADAAQVARAEKLAEQQQRAEAEWLAETERLAQQEEDGEAAQRAQAQEHLATLAEARAQIEHQRARTIAAKRLAEARLVEFGVELPKPAVQTDAPDLVGHLVALRERLYLYESAVAAAAGLAAHAADITRHEHALREQERMLERVRSELTQTSSALALAERDVQAAHQAEADARREQERAAHEREKERARATLERERTREQERQSSAREGERIAQERERIGREHAQLVRERERQAQERAHQQERARERRQRELEQQQRDQERERELVRRQRAQEHEQLTREKERAENEVNVKAARVTGFAAQLETISAQRDEKQRVVEQMRGELQALKDAAFPDEVALSESEPLQSELEERETEMRAGLTIAEELHNRAVLEAERRRAEIARLEQEIEDDLGPVELDSAAPRQLRLRLDVPRANVAGAESATDPSSEESAEATPEAPEQELIALPEVDSLPDGFDKEIRRLKNQMRYIGNVNPNAPEEYKELKERHAFLTEQAGDLSLATERLHQAIHELDAMMQHKFLDTFNAINAEFKKYFSMLFGGGSARLELTDPADLIHSGIEISARPPGKRQAQLVLLSGGERALTAAALIFAILRVSPTPFCVMDEVDAALDEANVGRFRDGLKELAAATQFIVITHNRVTMEGARAIYGVSMGEDGVSQVLSLKFEQAIPQAG